MAIPKNVKEAIDPYFRIDECADSKELQAWLTWTAPAIYDSSVELANAKYDHELSEFEYDKEYGQQYKISQASGSVTDKKEDAKSCESVIKKERERIEAKHKVRMAEALVESVKEKAGCIRKIATLRSNMVQFDEGDLANKRKDSKSMPSSVEQPYSSDLGNFSNFMQ